MIPPVLDSIVCNDLCIGCGVCAAMCPDSILEMISTPIGEYRPKNFHDCTKHCGICLKVCPFSDSCKNEDVLGRQQFGDVAGIQHMNETGYFLDSFTGFSKIPGHREHGASGGMATWFLETLFSKGFVDAVICVTSNPDPEKLFRFAVMKNIEEIRAGAGSVYYPVELSEVLTFILNNDGRYALIGLPCFVKALRAAQGINKLLSTRIIVLAGLTCGQVKNKNYTAYLASCAGLKTPPVRVLYRGKDPHMPASNYFFTAVTNEGKEQRLFLREGISDIWVNRWFTPTPCNYCDDIFAECADITFMDAWLPEFRGEKLGTTLILVRSGTLLPLLKKADEVGTISIQRIPPEKILISQSGRISVKREQIMYRLHLAQQSGHVVPKKRVSPVNTNNLFLRWKIRAQRRMQEKSRWLDLSFSGKKPVTCPGDTQIENDLRFVRWLSYLDYPSRFIAAIKKRLS